VVAHPEYRSAAPLHRDAPNQHRAEALLHLLTFRYNGWVDGDAWTGLIRDPSARAQGRATQQRLRNDQAAGRSLP
jgi:hypothetical protein